MKKALIADDEPNIQELLRIHLQKSGYVVDSVSTGRALYALGGIPYDLILLDIYMPDWSGLEGIALARAFGNNSPVLVITGYAERVFDLQGFDILTKPFSLEELDHAIYKVLEKYRSSYPDKRLLNEV